jgi:quercetin dioxygenase-like cupin family protein
MEGSEKAQISRRTVMRYGAVAAAAAATPVLPALAQPAHATPPKGVTSEVIARATLAGDYAAHVHGIKVKIKGPVDVVVIHTTIEPGGTLGWHSHPGATLVMVTRGTVTRIDAPRCTRERFSAGQGFAEEPNVVHVAFNKGSERAELYGTFIVPVRAEVRIDEPAPAHCKP